MKAFLDKYLKVIDWYIIRKYLGTFVYTLAIFSVVMVVFDISEHLDNFLKSGTTLHEIAFKYYAGFNSAKRVSYRCMVIICKEAGLVLLHAKEKSGYYPKPFFCKKRRQAFAKVGKMATHAWYNNHAKLFGASYQPKQNQNYLCGT